MRVYNTNNLNNKSRFQNAILFGAGSAILCALVYAFIRAIINFHSPIFYLLFAYMITQVVKKYGKGVHVKFSYLAVGLFLLSIFLTNILYALLHTLFYYAGDVLLPMSVALEFAMHSLFDASMTGIIQWLIIIFGVQYTYTNARVI